MKKLIYMFVAGAALTLASCSDSKKEEATPAPTPTPAVAVAKKNTALFIKSSGTKCPPCGGWGWTLSENMIAYGEGKSLYMGIFSANFVSQGFITNEANDMDSKWAVSSWPSFFVNGKVQSGSTVAAITTACEESVDEFQSADVVANTGAKMTYVPADGKIKIEASTQFFKASEGEYNVAFYVVENKAMWAQSGNAASNGTTAIEHHYVMRGSANGTWGESKFTGTIEAGAFKNFTAEMVVNPAWKMENVSVYAVIWKKSGTKYTFVNASVATK